MFTWLSFQNKTECILYLSSKKQKKAALFSTALKLGMV
jgi:hypothetical protein